MATITEDLALKRFIVSNAQANLVEYASSVEDFQAKFRIDSLYVRAIHAGLDLLGVQKHGVTYLARSMQVYLDLSSDPTNFQSDVRFVGPLSVAHHVGS